MCRRGISEVIASILLVATIAVASLLAATTSSKQITESEKTIEEELSNKAAQIQELLGVISAKTASDKISLEIINYGLKEIVLESVLVDGKESGFALKDDDIIITNNTIPKKRILVLETNTTGNSVQLITDTGNLINIKS
jgi:flagellin-like protein